MSLRHAARRLALSARVSNALPTSQAPVWSAGLAPTTQRRYKWSIFKAWGRSKDASSAASDPAASQLDDPKNREQFLERSMYSGVHDSTDDCSVSSNEIISSDLQNGVHVDSKLAALHLSNDYMRVYFQAPKANIWVMHNDNGNWSGSNLIGGAVEGSYITAAAENKTNLHAFYVDNSTQRLAYVDYSDILGADDSETISDSPGSSWSPGNALSSVYVPEFESYRVYYTNLSTGNIVSYFMNTTELWHSNHDNAWDSPDSSIASVAWSNKVRLFYFQDSKLVMSSQDNSVWADPEELGS